MQLHDAEAREFVRRTPRSLQTWLCTKELIPAGHGGGMGYFLPHPIMVDHAKGCWLWDVDGNRYLDLRIGDWVVVHGHCDDDIAAAVAEQMTRSVQIGGPEWDLGYRMAQQLVGRIPSVEKVRFFASGTDANLCALRVARAFTGREKLAKVIGSYHGTADVFTVGQSILRDPGDFLPAGLPARIVDEIVEIPYNDPDGAEEILTQHAAELAAVFVEPVLTAAGMIEAKPEYLHRLREVTARHGIVLVFDEVVTLPVAFGGAQAHYGVTPDLTTMGKAIGGGLPASAVGGRADLMAVLEPGSRGLEPTASVMATFGGNQVAMAAGIAALAKLTPAANARMAALGDRMRAGIDALGRRHGIPLHATGLGHLTGIHWAERRVIDYRTRLADDREKIVNINLALVNRGIYQTFTGLFLASTALGESEVDLFLATLDDSLHALGYVR